MLKSFKVLMAVKLWKGGDNSSVPATNWRLAMTEMGGGITGSPPTGD